MATSRGPPVTQSICTIFTLTSFVIHSSSYTLWTNVLVVVVVVMGADLFVGIGISQVSLSDCFRFISPYVSDFQILKQLKQLRKKSYLGYMYL